jgi:hypothetical protein
MVGIVAFTAQKEKEPQFHHCIQNKPKTGCKSLYSAANNSPKKERTTTSFTTTEYNRAEPNETKYSSHLDISSNI